MMCSGTILQFGVKRVVVGEDENFPGNIDFLRAHGVEVVLLKDPRLHRPDAPLHRRAAGAVGRGHRRAQRRVSLPRR